MNVRLLVCGSSHRTGGAGGWTDERWLADVLTVLRPDEIAHGASPSRGADAIADKLGRAHYRMLGLRDSVHPFPMRPTLDGRSSSAFMRRNTRMGRTFFPDIKRSGALDYIPLGIALCVGRVGQSVGTRGNYLSNGTQNMVDWLLQHRIPTVIRREDATEPYSSVKAARSQIGRLYQLTGDVSLGPVWYALDALLDARLAHSDVIRSLQYSAMTSRWAACIEAVQETVRKAGKS